MKLNLPTLAPLAAWPALRRRVATLDQPDLGLLSAPLAQRWRLATPYWRNLSALRARVGLRNGLAKLHPRKLIPRVSPSQFTLPAVQLLQTARRTIQRVANLFRFRRQPPEPTLLAITPPRTGERTLLGVENLLQSIAAPEPFSLELAGQADGVRLLARCATDEVVRAQISAHYPQARVQQLGPEDDPLRLGEGEQVWSVRLRPSGPAYAPLRLFRERDLLDPGSDPLLALVGALGRAGAGERLVARLRLRGLGPDWSRPFLAKAFEPAAGGPHAPRSPTSA